MHSWCFQPSWYVVQEPWLFAYDLCPRFPGGSDGKSVCQQCRRPGFDSWVGKITWRRKCNPLQYSGLNNPHGWSGLAGYSSWGHTESDTTERLHFTCVLTLKWCLKGFVLTTLFLFIQEFFFFFTSLHSKWVLVSQPEIEPIPPALKIWSLNHWGTRELSYFIYSKSGNKSLHPILYKNVDFLDIKLRLCFLN